MLCYKDTYQITLQLQAHGEIGDMVQENPDMK